MRWARIPTRERRISLCERASLMLLAGLLVSAVLFAPTPPARASGGVCPYGVALPPQVTLIVEGSHDELILWGVCRGIVDVEMLAQEHGLSLPRATTVYVFESPSAARRLGTPPYRRWGINLSGAAFGTRAAVLTTNISAPPMRWWGVSFEITVHELLHVLQHPINEAIWLAEGAATYFQVTRRDEVAGAAERPNPQARAHFLSSLNTNLRRLDRLESYTGFHRTWETSYAVALAAFELLVSELENGVDDYLSCFIPQKQRTPWRTAFATCFGMTVTEFYDLWDEYEQGRFLEFPSQARELLKAKFEATLKQCRLGAVLLGPAIVRAYC